LEEKIGRFAFLNSLTMNEIAGELSYRMIEEMKRQLEDSMGKVSIGGFGEVVDLSEEEHS